MSASDPAPEAAIEDVSDVVVDDAPETAADAAAEVPAGDTATRPVTRRFRKTFTTNRLTADEARRQGSAATLAWGRLGSKEAVVAFLNTHHDELGGRPIDVAVKSDAGLAEVERVLPAAK